MQVVDACAESEMNDEFSPQLDSGVYVIENILNGNTYIGSSMHLKRRWTIHRWFLRNGSHHNNHLQNAFNCYGEGAFIFKPLILCALAALACNEQFAIDLLKPVYNDRRIPVERTPEIIQHIKERKKGVKLGPQTEEHRRKIGATRQGKKMSEETRQKLSLANKGRKRTPEMIARMSMVAKGHPAWNKGVPASEECRKNISIGLRKTYENNDELHLKLSMAQRGRVHSEETKRKMSESAKKRRERERQECK